MTISVKTRPHGGKNYNHELQRKQRVYEYAQMKELQALDLDSKIKWSKTIIERAVASLKNPSVAFSAGKDSTVLLHLLLQYKPDILVIYGNTRIEFPECVKFARDLKKTWNLNYHEAVPEVTFKWVVKEYGWPLMGKTFGVGGVAHKSSRDKFFKDLAEKGELKGDHYIQSEIPISSACCTFLKERPSEKKQKQLGVDGVFLGILAGESRQRTFNFLKYGEWYKPKTQRVWKCHPLSIWNDEDIWTYIRRYNVPYAALYDMGFTDEEGKRITHKRNGCMYCGMDLKFPNNHLAIMRRTHPKIWKYLMVKMGLGKVLLDLHVAIFKQYNLFGEIMPLDEYLDMNPCAFDRI